MTRAKRIVLDANILIRAVFGVRVKNLLESYEDSVSFYCPDVCLADARRSIPDIATKRGLDLDACLDGLNQVARIVAVVDRSLYQEMEWQAKRRIAARDIDDWPIVAAALVLEAPIWTEDRDFFGGGVATWTSDRVEQFLEEPIG